MNFNYNSKSAIEHKRFKIDNFLGVDFASTKINANKSRAVEMKNFINRDGVNRKRYGWNEVLKIVDNLGNPLPINGFWYFKDSFGIEHKIVHAGTRIFKITNLGANSFESTYQDITPVALENKILNQRSNGIVRGDFLYLFLGQVYAMFGKWNNSQYELRAVENGEKTYIPTTTIGISAIGSSINSRQVLEEVNLLTSKRRNKLIGELISGDGARHSIEDMVNNDYFDGSSKYASTYNKGYVINQIIYDGIEEILIEIKTVNNSTITKTFQVIKDNINRVYTSNAGATDYIYDIEIQCNASNQLTATIYIGSVESGTINAYVITKSITYQLDSKNISVNSIKINGNEVYPNNSIFVETTLGRIIFEKTLLEQYPPLIVGENNIVVEFSKTVSDNADKINYCKFGQVFGYNDLENLFVSGNPNLPNMDFHSNIPDGTESTSGIPIYDDLTYFGDLSYAVLGSKQSKIMGYTLLEDGTLAIHKEAYKNEPSIYIRQASIDNVVDISGNVVYDINGTPYKKVVYPQFAGNISEGMITPFASANLSGDKLFLSKNGVYGLVMNENIKSNERFARERSRLINPRLVKESGLENASAIAYDNRYYLSVNGNCYVADSRFKNQYAPEMDDTFSYEWWYWDNIPARIWFIHNGILGFGTDLGQVCLFERDDHIDRHYTTIPNGGLMIDIVDNEIIVNFTYLDIFKSLKEKDTFRLSANKEISRILITSDGILDATNGLIKVDLDSFLNVVRYYDGKAVKTIGLDTLDDIDYILSINDYDDNSFILRDKLTYEIIDINSSSFSINYVLNDIDTYIYEINEATQTFKIGDIDGNVYDLGYISEQPTTVMGYFSIKDNVECLHTTPIFDLGTAEYSKNLVSMTLTPEAILGGQIEYGYKTREKESLYNIGGVDLFNFNTIDFTRFTFETSTFAKSDTRKIKVKNFNFIQFYYRSNNDKDCVVNSMSVTYTLGRLNKGVK